MHGCELRLDVAPFEESQSRSSKCVRYRCEDLSADRVFRWGFRVEEIDLFDDLASKSVSGIEIDGLLH